MAIWPTEGERKEKGSISEMGSDQGDLCDVQSTPLSILIYVALDILIPQRPRKVPVSLCCIER